uniref:Apyrase n=1 Tax=Lygus hesperus TaxID=30085 RepID=A0A0A9Z966_LYGHE
MVVSYVVIPSTQLVICLHIRIYRMNFLFKELLLLFKLLERIYYVVLSNISTPFRIHQDRFLISLMVCMQLYKYLSIFYINLCIYLTGMSIIIDTNRKQYHRVVCATLFDTPIDETQMYNIVISSFIKDGGDACDAYKLGVDITKPSLKVRFVIVVVTT